MRCAFTNEDGASQETSHTYANPPGGLEGAVGYRVYTLAADFYYLATYR